MASDRIQKIVNKFVADIVEAVEGEVWETVRGRLGESLVGSMKPPKSKRRKSTKKLSMIRPCPIDGCDKMAAPRYRMVCKDHSKKLSRRTILEARDKANRPGGIWYEMKHAKKQGSSMSRKAAKEIA